MNGNALNIIGLLERIKSGKLADATGEGAYNNTPSFLNNLRFASKDEQKKAANEASHVANTAEADAFAYDTAVADYDTGSKADARALNQRQMEYVPFAYTLSSDKNAPTQYGYIIRYANAGNDTIYGVTTETKDYTADGAKDFFNKIKENGGYAKLYNGTDDLSKIEKVVNPVYGEVRWPAWAGGQVDKVRIGSKMNSNSDIRHRALQGSYSLVDAIRDMNDASRKGKFGQ